MKISNSVDKKPLVITLSSILFCGLFLIGLLFFESRRQERVIAESLEEELIAIENKLYDRFDHTHNIINELIREIKKRPYNKKYINNLIQVYRHNPQLRSDFSWTFFSWTDSKYNIIVDTKYGVMKKPYDLSGRDYIDSTKEEPGKFFLGRPVIGSTSYKWMIPGGVGAEINEKYLGSMVIGFEIDALANLIQKTINNSDTSFVLLYKDAKPILRAENVRYNSYRNLERELDNEILLAVCDLEETDYEQLSNVSISKNKIKAILVRKSHKYPFILALKYDEDKIRAKLVESYVSKVKISLLILMALAAIILSTRFAFV